MIGVGRYPLRPAALHFGYLRGIQLDRSRPDDLIDLVGVAEAHDRPTDPRLSDDPRDRHSAGRRAVAFPDLAEARCQLEVGSELRLAEARIPASPIV